MLTREEDGEATVQLFAIFPKQTLPIAVRQMKTLSFHKKIINSKCLETRLPEIRDLNASALYLERNSIQHGLQWDHAGWR